MELQKYLGSGKHLPKCMRDFHDQKDLFKSIHHLYQDSPQVNMPSWMIGHQYVIDWFLWFMASRGYTLQKTRAKNIEFLPWPSHRDIMSKELINIPVSPKD